MYKSFIQICKPDNGEYMYLLGAIIVFYFHGMYISIYMNLEGSSLWVPVMFFFLKHSHKWVEALL